MRARPTLSVSLSVSLADFKDCLNAVYSAIEEADFLAIDGEFSGEPCPRLTGAWNWLEPPATALLDQVLQNLRAASWVLNHMKGRQPVCCARLNSFFEVSVCLLTSITIINYTDHTCRNF